MLGDDLDELGCMDYCIVGAPVYDQFEPCKGKCWPLEFLLNLFFTGEELKQGIGKEAVAQATAGLQEPTQFREP